MPKWGEKWDDYETQSLSGWTDMAFSEYMWREKEDDNAWVLLKFKRDGAQASLSLNFFPTTDHEGRAKAHKISMGKLHQFFEAAGCDKDTMPDLEPDSIKSALDAYDVSGIQVGCFVKQDDKGYNEVTRFRKAK